MLHLGDHAPHLRIVGKNAFAAELIQSEPDQRRFLNRRTADVARDLLDGDGLSAFAHGLDPQSVASASTLPRRDCSTETLRPRRAATERGLSCSESALNVARTML